MSQLLQEELHHIDQKHSEDIRNLTNAVHNLVVQMTEHNGNQTKLADKIEGLTLSVENMKKSLENWNSVKSVFNWFWKGRWVISVGLCGIGMIWLSILIHTDKDIGHMKDDIHSYFEV